jgi:hypothetical protein
MYDAAVAQLSEALREAQPPREPRKASKDKIRQFIEARQKNAD